MMSERPVPYIWHLFASMPSTNVRIAGSILMALATCFVMLLAALIVVLRGVGTSWVPSYEWLGFLVLWAGLDVGQFIGKRTTDATYVTAKQGLPPAEPPLVPKPPEIGT